MSEKAEGGLSGGFKPMTEDALEELRIDLFEQCPASYRKDINRVFAMALQSLSPEREAVKSLGYCIVNSDGKMHWSECCVASAKGDLVDELEMLQHDEPDDGWDIVPFAALKPAAGNEYVSVPKSLLNDLLPFLTHKNSCKQPASNFQKNKPCSCGKDAIRTRINDALFPSTKESTHD